MLAAAAAPAQNFSPAGDGSSVKFTIKNFGIPVSGTFTGLKGKIMFDAANPAAAFFYVTVNAATINTGITARDNHLKKEEYLNAGKYPFISFVSEKVVALNNAGMFTVTANITVKGTTKEVSFPFSVAAKNDGYIFTGNFKLNRQDFNVGGNSITLSDNLTVSLSVYVKKV